MKNKISLKQNFIYNFLLNIINILFPLITSPYISRVLGADNLGKYNFSISLSNWFLIFATFGTTTYGIREIAKVRNNKKDLNKRFTEIFTINFIATVVTLVIYLIFILINNRTRAELLLFFVSAATILLNVFCIDWLYMGLEDFKIITIRSLIIKVICMISMFIFVREKNDYVIYALISALAFGVTNIFNFIYSRRIVKFEWNEIELKNSAKAILVFFYSSIIVSMYTLFDQVFLGFFSQNTDVAFYARSKQIYSIALSITLTISTILLPKLAHLFENNFEEYKQLLKKSINYVYIFSIPSVVGLMILSKDIMYLFGGKEFESAYIGLSILSILVFTVSLSTWQYNQLFIPVGEEKVGLMGQSIIAITSVCMNIILVPKLGYIGASISLTFAEIIGTGYSVYYAKNKIKIVKVTYITQSCKSYILASIVMMIVIIGMKCLNFDAIVNILLALTISPIIYFTILYITKEAICREFMMVLIKLLKRK